MTGADDDPPAPAPPFRGPEPPKDRLVQTRVPRELETRIKREARRRRLTVSQLIRNLLEDTVDLVDGVLENVDDIVADAVDLAEHVGRGARQVARAASRGSRRPAPPGGEADDPLAHVDAWNPVILNKTVECARCAAALARGQRGYAGLGRGPTAWLCERCIEELEP